MNYKKPIFAVSPSYFSIIQTIQKNSSYLHGCEGCYESCPTYLCRSASFQSKKLPFSDQRDGCRGDRVISVVKHPKQWLLRPERPWDRKTEGRCWVLDTHKKNTVVFVPKDLRMLLSWVFLFHSDPFHNELTAKLKSKNFLFWPSRDVDVYMQKHI